MGTVLKIQDQYDEQLKNKLAAAEKETAAAKMPYTYNISQAPKAYDAQRSAAYKDDAVNQRALRERLSNMGFAAGGGASQDLQQRRATGLQGRLMGVGLEQQNYIDSQNQAMAQLDAQHQTNVAGITADNRAQMNAALSAEQSAEQQRKWEEESLQRKLAQERELADLQRRFQEETQQREIEAQKKQQEWSNILSLYMSGKMKKKQFLELAKQYGMVI